jgi:hypothetical protein
VGLDHIRLGSQCFFVCVYTSIHKSIYIYSVPVPSLPVINRATRSVFELRTYVQPLLYHRRVREPCILYPSVQQYIFFPFTGIFINKRNIILWIFVIFSSDYWFLKKKKWLGKTPRLKKNNNLFKINLLRFYWTKIIYFLPLVKHLDLYDIIFNMCVYWDRKKWHV